MSCLMRLRLALLLPLLAAMISLGSVAPARAESEATAAIAATVNDSAITTQDVAARTSLALLSSGMPDTQEFRQRIRPQVLRSLVDEQLQLQEARRLDIEISDDELNAALNNMARDNRIPGGDMRAFLRARGVQPATLEAQARANLAWIKVVRRTLRPRVQIGDDEVDAAIERLRANAGKTEYLVSEIFLAVDNPAEDSHVRDVAQKMKDEISRGGSFTAIARQFSQGAGAAAGGDIGWIQLGQLAPEIDQALGTMEKNQIAGPIHTAAGYHIIGVRDVRTLAAPAAAATQPVDKTAISARLIQLTLPLGLRRDKVAAMTEANKVRPLLKSCQEASATIAHIPDWKVEDMGLKKISDYPDWLSDIAASGKIDEASPPLPLAQAVALFMVCERTGDNGTAAASGPAPDRAAITNAIGLERLENLARRLLRDLKRSAYIDVRQP